MSAEQTRASMYKIRYAWKAGGASSSEIVYAESRVSLEIRLLQLLIDMESRPPNHERRGGHMPWLTWRYWARRAEMDTDTTRYPTRILAVQELVDGQWVDLVYEVTPPKLLLTRGPEPCGAPALGGPCRLPAGHNMGQADVPGNHSSSG